MFPPHTLPGGSWHTFILGKLWGAIRGLGEIFSSMFGLLIVGRLVWYVIKVLMNCNYIHSVHGCSAQLAWSFCTEVFFTRIYRREQRQHGSAGERSDNNPSSRPNPNLQTRILNFGNFFSPKNNDNSESGNPDGGLPIPMSPLLRSQSVSHLRKDTDSTCPNRLQAQLDRALAAFQPYPPGMSGSPLPPDYVNDPMVGFPLDSIKTRPSAPVTTGEVARAGIEPPPVPGRIGPSTRVIRTPNRFTFTTIPVTQPTPTPQSRTPPAAPVRESTGSPGTSSDEPPPLPSR